MGGANSEGFARIRQLARARATPRELLLERRQRQERSFAALRMTTRTVAVLMLELIAGLRGAC